MVRPKKQSFPQRSNKGNKLSPLSRHSIEQEPQRHIDNIHQ